MCVVDGVRGDSLVLCQLLWAEVQGGSSHRGGDGRDVAVCDSGSDHGSGIRAQCRRGGGALRVVPSGRDHAASAHVHHAHTLQGLGGVDGGHGGGGQAVKDARCVVLRAYTCVEPVVSE